MSEADEREADEPEGETRARAPRRRAFAGDTRAYAAAAAAKALWWGAAGVAARALARPAEVKPPDFAPLAEPPPAGFVRRAWLSAFEKEAADVAAGLYPAMDDRPANPVAALRRTADFIADAMEVEARRRRGDGREVRAEAPASYPAYYRQNFHFQSGGWFTAESAGRYEAQVEALFAGTAGAMRRRALSLLAKGWRTRDHRGLAVLDLACGAGAFLGDLARAFPRARLIGADLSPAYVAAARAAAPRAALVQAKAEQLPFADASLDAVTCVYLFHELPPKVRTQVAAEIGRVLKPGGRLALADSIQPADEPRLARLLEAFPAYFHEPYYAGYAGTDLPALFAQAGLSVADRDSAFLTKALLFEKG
ncbi:MAG TPA: class I SAM-dependent methyltransferase [Caulobacteraceae bacterium]